MVDCGFYANIKVEEINPRTEPIILEKRNRIFIFDKDSGDLSFTNVADSVNFDFEDIESRYYKWTGSL